MTQTDDMSRVDLYVVPHHCRAENMIKSMPFCGISSTYDPTLQKGDQVQWRKRHLDSFVVLVGMNTFTLQAVKVPRRNHFGWRAPHIWTSHMKKFSTKMASQKYCINPSVCMKWIPVICHSRWGSAVCVYLKNDFTECMRACTSTVLSVSDSTYKRFLRKDISTHPNVHNFAGHKHPKDRQDGYCFGRFVRPLGTNEKERVPFLSCQENL